MGCSEDQTFIPKFVLFEIDAHTKSPSVFILNWLFLYSSHSIILKYSYITKCTFILFSFVLVICINRSLLQPDDLCLLYTTVTTTITLMTFFLSNSAFCLLGFFFYFFFLSRLFLFSVYYTAVFPTSTGVTVYTDVYKWIKTRKKLSTDITL